MKGCIAADFTGDCRRNTQTRPNNTSKCLQQNLSLTVAITSGGSSLPIVVYYFCSTMNSRLHYKKAYTPKFAHTLIFLFLYHHLHFALKKAFKFFCIGDSSNYRAIVHGNCNFWLYCQCSLRCFVSSHNIDT